MKIEEAIRRLENISSHADVVLLQQLYICLGDKDDRRRKRANKRNL